MMKDNEDTLQVVINQGVKVVRFAGSGFLDEERLSLVGEDLFQAVADMDKPLVVLDMSNVSFCSSSIIGKFVAFYKTVTNKGGKLKFAGLQKPIAEVFRVTKLDQLFEISPTVDEALLSVIS